MLNIFPGKGKVKDFLRIMAYSPQFNLLLVLWLGENDTKRGNSRFIKSCLGQLYLLLCLTGDLSENWAHIGTFGTNVSGPIFDTLGYKICHHF